MGGSVSCDLSGAVPHIKGALSGQTLDLDALLPKTGTATTYSGVPSGADKPIDFSQLDKIVADLNLSLTKVILSGVAITPLVAAVHVGEGKLNIVADHIGVGAASGSGSLALDAHRDVPYASGKVRIVGADLATVGKLAGSNLPVTGTASADVVFASVGRSVAKFQQSLNASGFLTLSDGAATLADLGDIVGDPKANRVDAISLKVTFDDLLKPVTVTGAATWRSERFALNATGDVRGLLAGKPSAVDAKATAKRVSAGFKGSLSPKGVGSGRISLETASLTELMRWLGQQPAWQSGFGPFAVNGKLTVTDNSILFEDTAFKLDNTSGTGNGKIRLGKKASVEAQLTLDTLDITPYLGAAGNAGGGGGPARWSDAKIDFSALNAIDAKLALSTKQLIYKEIKTGMVAIQAVISGGKLDAKLPNLKLYKGTGNGALSVDASGKSPSQVFRFVLQNIDAYPFLSDAAGFHNVEGTGAMTIDFTASGASQRSIVSALNGTVNFKFTDGAIRGVNLAKIVRSLTSGTISGWGSGEADKTDFASLGASFKVAQGQAQTDDLQLIGPLVRMAGSGTVNMPAQSIQFRINPQVVASLEGQGGEADMQGLGVPVVIAGPWAKPTIYPDIAGILQNPTAAYEQLRKLGGGLFALPAAGALGGKLGGVNGVAGIVKDGKIDKEALQQGAITGLDQLLKKKQQAAPAPGQPDSEQKPAANADSSEKKKGKNKKKIDAQAGSPADPNADPEAAANQLLQKLLGSQR